MEQEGLQIGSYCTLNIHHIHHLHMNSFLLLTVTNIYIYIKNCLGGGEKNYIKEMRLAVEG